MKRLFLIFAILLFIIIVGVGGFVYLSLTTPVSHQTATLAIQRGTPLVMIAEQLGRAGVIKYPPLFTIFARVKHIDRHVKAGEYEFGDGLSAMDVLRKLEKGECKLYKITLIEGWTIFQMADYLSKQPFSTPGFPAGFIKSSSDKFFVRSLGINADSAEGYLFPNTYLIERPGAPELLVGRLIEEFKKNYIPEFKERADQIGMTEEQVVTLASIIEKETGSDAERGLVSSVFHNRLKKNMPLQSDPTVIYAIKNYDGNIRKSDLSNPSPYNTYMHQGLPPGPIANPGLASIKAALWPAVTDYLYFVARGDGTHEFTTNLVDHNKAVTKYQLNRSK